MPDNEFEKKEGEKSVDTSLDTLAMEFANKLPENTFTPAEIQGYMLMHRESRENAVACFDSWIAEQFAKKQKIKKRKDRSAAKKADKVQQSGNRQVFSGFDFSALNTGRESASNGNKEESQL